jgi:hypothetical protein
MVVDKPQTKLATEGLHVYSLYVASSLPTLSATWIPRSGAYTQASLGRVSLSEDRGRGYKVAWWHEPRPEFAGNTYNVASYAVADIDLGGK